MTQHNTLSFFSRFIIISALGLGLILTTGCMHSSLGKGGTSGYLYATPYNNDKLPTPIAPLPTSQTEGDWWGAIAASKDITVLNDPKYPYLFGIGNVINYGTAEEAAKAAMAECESDNIVGCKLLATFQGQCIAFSYNYKAQLLTWAIGKEGDSAKNKAQDLCSKQEGAECLSLSTQCNNLAGTAYEEPLAVRSPEFVATLSHRLSIYAKTIAELRNKGVSKEVVIEALGKAELSDALYDLFLLQVDAVYGPLKSFSPEQIQRWVMYTFLHELSY